MMKGFKLGGSPNGTPNNSRDSSPNSRTITPGSSMDMTLGSFVSNAALGGKVVGPLNLEALRVVRENAQTALKATF